MGSNGWWWLGLLALTVAAGIHMWRSRTEPLPALIVVLQVTLVVGLAGYTVYRFIA